MALNHQYSEYFYCKANFFGSAIDIMNKRNIESKTMFNQLTKPLIAAIGSIFMLTVLLACQAIGARPHAEEFTNSQINVDDLKGHSLSIKQFNDAQRPVYILDGKTYRWEDLNSKQQAELAQIEKRMEAVESKLKIQEKSFAPVIKEMEAQARAMELHAREVEKEARDIEKQAARLNLKSVAELEKTMQKLEIVMQEKEVAMQVQAQKMHAKEKQLRKMEKELHKDARIFEKEMNHNIERVIKILEAG